MNQWNPPPQDSSITASTTAAGSAPQTVPNRSHRKETVRERSEVEGRDPAARKVQKADREKLRRNRLNDHFHELGITLDPERPRNDKATILTETIQILKDLTDEVSRLKTEHKVLSEESRKLMQEKNELREEKASLKSDIGNLNAQYEQRVRNMPSWTAIDQSIVMSSPYPYPVPIPFPFFGNQNPGHIPSMCSMYVPYSAPANPPAQHASTSHVFSRKDSRSKSPCHRRNHDAERCSESPDVATELELKMPGSSTTQEDCTSGGRKGKHAVMSDRIVIDGSSSSRCSSSQGLQDSSNSIEQANEEMDHSATSEQANEEMDHMARETRRKSTWVKAPNTRLKDYVVGYKPN